LCRSGLINAKRNDPNALHRTPRDGAMTDGQAEFRRSFSLSRSRGLL
jgi:hypothetical protein